MRILFWDFPNALLYNFSRFGQGGRVLRASNARPYLRGFRERIIFPQNLLPSMRANRDEICAVLRVIVLRKAVDFPF